MTKKIAEKYKKLTHKEHILKRSETYIGSIQFDTKPIFIAENYEDDIRNTKIVYKEIKYNPGFIKIFDEILTNASDHVIRTNTVKNIKVSITDDTIIVENDGDGIPVVIHPEEKIYVPELIFGHLLTGENYDDEEERYVGGRNGYGAKLTNIYSTFFQVETADGNKTYKQKFTDNMSNMTKPSVRKSKQSFTRITYKPDFEKFSMEKIDDITKSILIKRIFDIAAYNPSIRVQYNGRVIPIRSFRDYIKMFLKDESSDIFYEKINDNWEIAISESPVDSFTHVSMVNGISTIVGGTHVNYMINYVVNNVKTLISKGIKGLNIRPNDIKNRIMLFVNCKLPNPVFDNQTKENLTLRITELVKDVKINDNLLRRLSKSDMFIDLIELSQLKEKLELEKQLNKQSNKRIRVDKLFDANNAGKLKKSEDCHLFLTEGDSARNLAVAGFSIIGRDNYGVFPLRGKPLNVRDTQLKKITENQEIKNIIQILGLEFGKKYKNISELRYGKVVIMSDSDTDGYHIKGLIINLFDTFWPELLKMDFLYEFVTPIIIATQGKRKKMFYKLNEFDKWLEETKTSNLYKIKYYKGLGTLGPQLGKELFKDLDKHLIPFNYSNPERTKDVIDLAFNKKRQDDRKEWLSNYKLNSNFDKFAQKTTYESFMDNEFIEYSMEDNVRNIPSVIDGLKPTQRKILYTFFKSPGREMNVGELFGHVKATAEYHHGPQSLEQGIINMAQDYVGSNNISLLSPNGSFGTRISGGKDSAAPRYIYTELRDITKNIFLKEDNNILHYLTVDGKQVEPSFYLPIIPQILLNGTEGIGTGWSSTIPKFKIEDLIQYIDNKLNNKRNNIILNPYFENFKGEVYYDSDKDNCVTKGVISKINDSTLNITELPIGVWNDAYYAFLDDLLDEKVIKSYQKNCTDDTVDIVIKIQKEILGSLTDDELFEMFKLESRINMSNMHLFDVNGKIKKYNDQYEIIEDYYDIRLEYYEKRRQYLINELETKNHKFSNIIKFIKLYISGELKINNIAINTIIKSLESNKIDKIDDSYDYLLRLSIYRLTKEELTKLKNDFNEIKNSIKELKETTPEKMWHQDLINLKSSVRKYRNDN